MPAPIPARALATAEQLAGRLARSVPERRLRALMSTPARRPLLGGLFAAAPRLLRRTRAHEITRAVRVHVTGRRDGGYDEYWVEYRDGGWRTGRGPGARDPELTITVDGAELLAIAGQRSNPLQAYLSGRLQASGDPMLAARLSMLIRDPAAVKAGA